MELYLVDVIDPEGKEAKKIPVHWDLKIGDFILFENKSCKVIRIYNTKSGFMEVLNG